MTVAPVVSITGGVGRVGGRGIGVCGFHRHTLAQCRAVLADYALQLVVAVFDSVRAADEGVLGLELGEGDLVVLIFALYNLDRIGRIVYQHFRVNARRWNVQAVIFHKFGIIDNFLQKAVIGVKARKDLINPYFFV